MAEGDRLEVTSVRALRAYEPNGKCELELAFSDGCRKTVDVKPLLTGIRRRLLYPDQFAQARVEIGIVVFPGERSRRDQAHITDLHFEPEVLYELEPVE